MAHRFHPDLIGELQGSLRSVGYVARRMELVAVAGMITETVNGHGARAALLLGPPGCGKTALSQAVAKACGGRYVFKQFHAWTDSDELFQGVDVAAAVAGDAGSVRQDGVLAIVARLSMEATPEKPVTVCLDEIDKAPERAEMLLLDWLQTGRVPLKPGVHLETRLENVLVFVTSNEQRELCDAMMRRMRRVRMRALPTRSVDALVAHGAKLDKAAAVAIAKLAREVASADKNSNLSLQEITKCAKEAMAVAEGIDDLRLIVSGWASRTSQGEDVVMSAGHAAIERALGSAWSEICRARAVAAAMAPIGNAEDGAA